MQQSTDNKYQVVEVCLAFIAYFSNRKRISTALRTLVTYDWERIAESVKKTSRVIVAHEDPLSYGYGAEIAARISDELFEYLDAPVRRVGATDTFVGYAPSLEDYILPQIETVEKAVQELMRY